MTRAIDLMKTNMLRYHEMVDIPWDVAWIEQNYANKESLIVQRSGEAIGFVSLENLDRRLHIHTVQLTPAVQHGRTGFHVFRHLLSLSEARRAATVTCCVFKDHPARSLYKKLGFVEVGESGVLVSLALPIDSYFVEKWCRGFVKWRPGSEGVMAN